MVTTRLCLVSLISSFIVISATAAQPDPWYQSKFDTGSGYSYVVDFELPAGQSRDVEIVSNAALMVGLSTSASDELTQRSAEKYIRLTQKGTENAIATLIGASSRFYPVGGKLQFVVKNETDVTLKIVIYKKYYKK
jgi:hypothetical protein